MRRLSVIQEFARIHSPQLCIPSHLLAVLLLIEDQRFPSHIGIDFFAMARAVRCNVLSIGKRQGASTLTQQLHNVRIMRREKVYRRTFLRKCAQVSFALVVGNRLEKREVIREYLQGVYWGKNLWGIEAATRWYFDKMPTQLTLEESFFLIERLASPNRLSIRRVEVILKRPIVKQYILQMGSTAEGILAYYRELERA